MFKKIQKFVLREQILTPTRRSPQANMGAYKISCREATPILFFTAFGLLVFIFLAGWKFILQPQSIAGLLPADKTIAYAEINIDPVNPQIKSFANLMQAHPFYSKEYFTRKISDFLEASYANSVAPWLGNNIGAALIITESVYGQPVIFIEYKSKSRAMQFLGSLAIKFKNDYLQETIYNGRKIYSYKFSQDFAAAFISDYLVAAQNIETLKKYIDAVSRNFLPISETREYLEANRDYFDLSLAHAYINLPIFTKSMAARQNLPQEQRFFFMAFDPIISVFKKTFVRFEAKNGYIKIKTATAFSGKFVQDITPYAASLVKYFPSNLKVFYGGQNLLRQISNFSHMMGNEANQFKKAAEDMARNRLKQILGDSISFEKDIYPLLAEEYALGVNQDDSVLFALKLKDPLLIEQKLKTLKISEKAHYKIQDGVLLISSAEIRENEQTFEKSKAFSSLVRPFIGNSDEIFYYDLNKYRESLLAVSPYLAPFSALAGGNKYSEFYVKTVYYVLADG